MNRRSQVDLGAQDGTGVRATGPAWSSAAATFAQRLTYAANYTAYLRGLAFSFLGVLLASACACTAKLSPCTHRTWTVTLCTALRTPQHASCTDRETAPGRPVLEIGESRAARTGGRIRSRCENTIAPDTSTSQLCRGVREPGGDLTSPTQTATYVSSLLSGRSSCASDIVVRPFRIPRRGVRFEWVQRSEGAPH